MFRESSEEREIKGTGRITSRVSGKGRGPEVDWTRADPSFEIKGISVCAWGWGLGRCSEGHAVT